MASVIRVMSEEYAVINVKKITKDRFDQLGTVADNQDSVMRKLIDFWTRYKDVVDSHA